MTMPLHPEQRQQLAALLAYCREMGSMDFYRGDQGSAADIAQLPDFSATPASFLNSASPDPSSSMPRQPNVPQLPPIIDFSSLSIPPQDRAAALRAIQEEIGDCTRCPLAFEGRHKIVFGDGDPNAELLFVGEGPGADEDMQGLPFVGRGGQLLNNMIAAMGLRREQVYIANIVKCRPPKNRVPEPIEATTCTPFLFRQIGVVRPRLIVALGATAATYLLGAKVSLSVLRGKIHDCMGTKLIVTYHPAYLLRDPRQKAEAWKDLQLAMKFLHLSPPERAGK
jgi:uracil-DNA glycosylase family 4